MTLNLNGLTCEGFVRVFFFFFFKGRQQGARGGRLDLVCMGTVNSGTLRGLTFDLVPVAVSAMRDARQGRTLTLVVNPPRNVPPLEPSLILRLFLALRNLKKKTFNCHLIMLMSSVDPGCSFAY